MWVVSTRIMKGGERINTHTVKKKKRLNCYLHEWMKCLFQGNGGGEGSGNWSSFFIIATITLISSAFPPYIEKINNLWYTLECPYLVI